MKKIILSLCFMIIISGAHAATCTYKSSYSSGTQYQASNCSNTLTATNYFTNGGSVRSCSSCANTDYALVSKTMTHSSGCTFTMDTCVPQKNFAYVVTSCSNSSNATIYKNLCNQFPNGGVAGNDSEYITIQAGLDYAIYQDCGVYNIRNVANEGPERVIMCFMNDIYTAGQYVSGFDMSRALIGCAAEHIGDDNTTYYINTDWDGYYNQNVTITNYAQWDCCNNNTECHGYRIDYSFTGADGSVLWKRPKQCSTNGSCNTVTASGKTSIYCNTGYYSSKGLSSYTITGSGAQLNPTNNTSKLGCTLCSTATSNDAATSATGANAITKCYVPSGTTGSDTAGSFQYTSDCYYTN